ncbi:hypothetical protein PVK06_048128 [Gossypium arboreum]|uniref:Uncharacterized protein n=1 Tax=Gossypium arboreum TaxID=29729 RepID=A0ABR0MHR3_GOSAR|nr:hypothetical protein PVK06_048128 [Gossypium arboreum]
MNLGDLHKVWEIKALKRKPGEEEAKQNLRENSQTSLTHYVPNNPALLGLNVGAGIYIKLSTIRDALSLIQAVAMAAERRLQDDIWCGSYCSDIAGDEKSCADTLQDHLDLDQGGERLSICGVGVLIMHFIESTWKGLETLAPSTNFGLASFAPWKTVWNWINAQHVTNGDIHMVLLYQLQLPMLAHEK